MAHTFFVEVQTENNLGLTIFKVMVKHVPRPGKHDP